MDICIIHTRWLSSSWPMMERCRYTIWRSLADDILSSNTIKAPPVHPTEFLSNRNTDTTFHITTGVDNRCVFYHSGCHTRNYRAAAWDFTRLWGHIPFTFFKTFRTHTAPATIKLWMTFIFWIKILDVSRCCDSNRVSL